MYKITCLFKKESQGKCVGLCFNPMVHCSVCKNHTNLQTKEDIVSPVVPYPVGLPSVGFIYQELDSLELLKRQEITLDP